MLGKVKIIRAPTGTEWYASHIGKQFRVNEKHETHYEVFPNKKKFPDNIGLLVRVEDCEEIKPKYHGGLRGRFFNGYGHQQSFWD